MMFYFLIMKYDFTNETYLPETISNFPGAPKMTFGDMISASLFYNIIPLLASFLLYYPIVYSAKKFFKQKSILSLMLTGFILTATTPIIYFAFSELKHNDYYLKSAEIIAWTLCFIISIMTYFLLNKNEKYCPTESIKLKNDKKNALEHEFSVRWVTCKLEALCFY